MKRAILSTTLVLVTATLLVPARVSADCDLSVNVVFSYPSAETSEVPLDAVFWAVPQDGFGAVSFRLDGTELQPLDGSVEGRFQFAPSRPLSPGMHDIEISTTGSLPERALEGDTLRLRVEAVEQTPVEADANIEAVTRYPLVASGGNFIYPGPDPVSEGCTALTTLDGCHDVIPESLIRLDLSANGDALGYLVEGALLPPTCRAFFPYEYTVGEAAPYEIRTILPTGLSAPRVFQGEVEIVPNAASVGVDESPMAPSASDRAVPESAGSCALQRPGAGASSAAIILLVAAGVFGSRRRRR